MLNWKLHLVYISVILSLCVGFMYKQAKVKEQLTTLQLATKDNVIEHKDNVIEQEGEARSAETEIANNSTIINQEVNAKVLNLNSKHDDLVRRLRIAEGNAATARLNSKAASASCAAEVASRDIGAELPGTIGEEDVAEARRAETIRLHLKAIYEQYDGAKEALKEYGTNE